MTNDKKTDRVISMEDFHKSAKAEKEGGRTVEEVLNMMKEHELDGLIAVGINNEGRMAFYTTSGDYGEILFLLEAYRKLVMEGVVF